MKLSFYFKLAASNIQKNKKNYLPYILSNIAIICIFFSFCSLLENIPLYSMIGVEVIEMLLGFGVYILGFFALIFLFYTNSFLFKRRKKDLGLYNVLGMEKRHLGIMTAFEIMIVSTLSLVIGLGIGALFYKFAELVLFKILNQPIIEGFHFSMTALFTTLKLFGSIFFLTFLHSLWQIRSVSAVSLMSGAKSGEKEPKTRYLMSLIGVISLGLGYYLAQTVSFSPSAIVIFFPAVILVMIGTYCLFTSISIAILKALKKNKRFYYHPTHFTLVSQMIYRMKQNAVGLANICILSTMVIVTLSTTISLYVGIDDVLRTTFPREISTTLWTYNESNDGYAYLDTDLVEEKVEELTQKYDVTLKDVYLQQYVSQAAKVEGNEVTTYDSGASSLDAGAVEPAIVQLIPQKYLSDVTQTLSEDEVLIYATHNDGIQDTIKINGKNYKVVGRIEDDQASPALDSLMIQYVFVVTKDENVVNAMVEGTADDIFWRTNYGFDFDGQRNQSFVDELEKSLVGFEDSEGNFVSGLYAGYLDDRDESRNAFNALYGGLFFIGLFLGTVFVIATVLIIYYKQISEGYDDASRFEIMKKVGMSSKEVKKTIQSQILGVFFMPLLVAGLHMIFAFRLIQIILSFLSLTNTHLFIITCIGVFIVFALFYSLVYIFTSKEYYKIVSQKN